MRVRAKKNVLTRLNEYPFVFNGYSKNINLPDFNIKNNYYIEVGSGKGDFVLSLIKRNSKNVFFAIEKNSTIIWKSVNKYVNYLKNSSNKDNNNLYFLNIDANLISKIFPIFSIDGIFLNFPDPWPKKRHAKRRLISKKFLDEYLLILKNNGFLRFHTDQKKLYEELLSNISLDKKWICVEKTENFYLNKSMNNLQFVLTEYEKKFINKGLQIYHILLRKNIGL